MEKMKRSLAVMLAIVMMVPSTVYAASGEGGKTDITNTTTTAAIVYTGVRTTLTIVLDGREMVEGVDFEAVGTRPITGGTYDLLIRGIGTYTGITTITYKVKKASKPIVRVTKKTQKLLKNGVKASELKKSSKKVKLAINAGGTVTKVYKVMGKKAKKYVKVDWNGNVTLKKGTPKGTYKIKIKYKDSPNYKNGYIIYKLKVK